VARSLDDCATEGGLGPAVDADRQMLVINLLR
jgi:hypothetical protein